jgi:DHA2 family multidrug resistance protein-like MFS transporter
MLDLALFRNHRFSVALGSNVLNVFISFGTFILVSQYLQLVVGLSPLQAGLVSLPASLLAIAGPMLSPSLAQRVGTPLALGLMLGVAGIGFGVQALIGGPQAAFVVAFGWMLWALGGSAAATLTTAEVIGAAPAERAGSVSAVAQAGAELGGALGIALLGSLGTAIYRSAVNAALPVGISPELAATARDTLGGALNVAGQLSDPAAAASLVLAAEGALTTALQVTSGIGAALTMVSAVAVVVWMREEEQRGPASSSSVGVSRREREPVTAA